MISEDLPPTHQIKKLVRELAIFLESTFEEPERAPQIEQLLQAIIASPRMIDDLAELYRIEPDLVVRKLREIGLSPSGRLTTQKGEIETSVASREYAAKLPQGISLSMKLPLSVLDEEGFRTAAISLDQEWADATQLIRRPDTFLSYYRSDPESYLRQFLAQIAPRIREFISKHFPNGFRYLVTVGIGASEQFWHCPQAWYARENLTPTWLICDNPKDISTLPLDARVDNTIFLGFSRSGKTQEIVKFYEFLTDEARVIVFASSGPLKKIANDRLEHTLSLPFPDSIPGRYGKNLTPLVIAPFEILKLPVDDYWRTINECITQWDLANESSPPAALARFIRNAQLARGVNHIYLGCNDVVLRESCAELVQFWNEGVAKSKNDLLISHYLGLPRDSHFNVEGLLANSATKIGVFLIRRNGDRAFRHPLRRPQIQPLNPKQKSLTIADVDYVLARANADHFSKCMPTIVLELDEPNLFHSAVLSQLWADMTYCYACLMGLNPGSNPEVRLVRDRADELLAEFAR